MSCNCCIDQTDGYITYTYKCSLPAHSQDTLHSCSVVTITSKYFGYKATQQIVFNWMTHGTTFSFVEPILPTPVEEGNLAKQCTVSCPHAPKSRPASSLLSLPRAKEPTYFFSDPITIHTVFDRCDPPGTREFGSSARDETITYTFRAVFA